MIRGSKDDFQPLPLWMSVQLHKQFQFDVLLSVISMILEKKLYQQEEIDLNCMYSNRSFQLSLKKMWFIALLYHILLESNYVITTWKRTISKAYTCQKGDINTWCVIMCGIQNFNSKVVKTNNITKTKEFSFRIWYRYG